MILHSNLTKLSALSKIDLDVNIVKTKIQTITCIFLGYCLYNGQQYTQGQTWDDDCEFTCVCDDASRGHYQCIER